MLGTYTFVEGASLTSLLFEVREDFWASPAYDLDDGRRPNSVRMVALNAIDARPRKEQLRVVDDLLDDRNSGLLLSRRPADVFADSDSIQSCVIDLICEVVCQVLLRDPTVVAENTRRIAIAQESLDALDDGRRGNWPDSLS